MFRVLCSVFRVSFEEFEIAQKKDLINELKRSINFCGENYTGLIASEGQTSAQVPQSVHTSASIT